MASNYFSVVQKYLEQNRVGCNLPEYIRRGWNRIYPPDEEEYTRQPCIIASDVQIPNSVVRHRLGTTQISAKAMRETLRKAFELPEELLLDLSIDQKAPEQAEDEQLNVDWNDDDDDLNGRQKKSVVTTILDKQRDRRRKHEDYNYDYDNTEALSLEEIIEEIRTNIGKDLKDDDVKLITELMQTISAHKQGQVMNVFDELTDVHLIRKFGGVPKLVQALQEIQKAFEQVAMKTNVASIETVIDVLLEKDETYRVALALLNSFNEYTKKNKQQGKLNLNDKSGDISDHDHTMFNMLINDRISRLSTSDLTTLISDLRTGRNVDANKMGSTHDDLVKYLSDQLNLIFTRAHFDGIRTTFQSMKSGPGRTLAEFIDQIEGSLKIKLTESEKITIESYIQAYLASLNDNQLKTIYERLAQQGTLKRHAATKELNQTITMGLAKKIESDGLGAVIENIKEAHLEIQELTQGLICVNNYIQTQPSVSIEQILNQLAMACFIETRELHEQDVQSLAISAKLYSLVRLPFPENATKDDCLAFVDELKAPVIRLCMQRILNDVVENAIDLTAVSSQFYNQHVGVLLDELRYGSEEFNRNALLRQVNEELKKNKDLTDRVYRQMLKEKLLSVDTKAKRDTEKKKLAMILGGIHQVFNSEGDRTKQSQVIEALGKVDIVLPERVKRWYKQPSTVPLSSSKVKNQAMDQKTNTKGPSATSRVSSLAHPRTNKSAGSLVATMKERVRPVKAIITAKPGNERKKSSLKLRSEIQQTTEPFIAHEETSEHRNEEEKLQENVQVVPASKPEEHRLGTPVVDDHKSGDLETEDDMVALNQLPIQLSTHSELTISKEVHPVVELEPALEASQSVPIDETNLTDIAATVPVESEPTTNTEDDRVNEASVSTELELFRPEYEMIHPSNITFDGIGENQTLDFQLQQHAALLMYSAPVSNDPEQGPHLVQNSMTVEYMSDSPYEKTKAQRVLAKAIPSSNAGQQTDGGTVATSASLVNLVVSNTASTSATSDAREVPDSRNLPANDPAVPLPTTSLDNIKQSATGPRRTLNKSLKQTESVYITSLTSALRSLFARPTYDSHKLRKIHDELISSGHISPLNEFYRSATEALRVTLDHCVTYEDLIRWALSLLQTSHKPNLIDFGHDLYSIAIGLDLSLIERIDETRCALEIQETLRQELQTIQDSNLREINSYLNASQLEKLVNQSKKLNVTSKDRMLADLHSFLLHLIQACHTFQPPYRPMQTHIREIAGTFKSHAVADLARHLDDVEKRLSAAFGVTLFGISKRLHESRFLLTK